MAEDSDDKTEEPTGKKLQEAKDNGQMGRSVDLSSAVMLLAGLCGMAIYGGEFATSCMDFMREYFTGFLDWTPSVANFSSLSMHVLQELFYMVAPIMAILLVAGLAANIAQVGLNFTTKPLEPDLAKVFSINNLTRLFGKDAWVELLKGVVKMLIVGFICYRVILSHYEDILYMPDMELGVFSVILLDILVEILLKVILLLMIFGAIDLFYQKRKTHNELKMTKNEVKDESKNTQGDPQVLSARRRAMLKLHQQFMMKEVPTATVVITNPTHLAIALRYERSTDQVPFVVAKGKDRVAERIREIAREHDVTIVENKPLARAMFDVVEVGEPIPNEFFAGVAEVLAYVFNSKPKVAGAV